MKTFKLDINKSLELTEEDICDIISTCFYGGWACIDNTEISWEIARGTLYAKENMSPTMEDIMTWILCTGRSIFIEDVEDDYERYSFDINDFLDAIGAVIEEDYWDGEDICDIDGEIGDAILQFAVFGEVVYG